MNNAIAIASIVVGIIIAVIGWILGAQPDRQLIEQNKALERQIELQQNMAIISLNENYKRLSDQFKEANEESDPEKRLTLLETFSKETEPDREYDHDLTRALLEELDNAILRAAADVKALKEAIDEATREKEARRIREAEAARLAESQRKIQTSLQKRTGCFWRNAFAWIQFARVGYYRECSSW